MRGPAQLAAGTNNGVFVAASERASEAAPVDIDVEDLAALRDAHTALVGHVGVATICELRRRRALCAPSSSESMEALQSWPRCPRLYRDRDRS
jgi:hypothetical protein